MQLQKTEKSEEQLRIALEEVNWEHSIIILWKINCYGLKKQKVFWLSAGSEVDYETYLHAVHGKITKIRLRLPRAGFH